LQLFTQKLEGYGWGVEVAWESTGGIREWSDVCLVTVTHSDTCYEHFNHVACTDASV